MQNRPSDSLRWPLPDPGVPIASVEVLHGTTPIATNVARAAAQRASAPSIDRLRAVDWREDNAVLSVKWDTSAASHIAVTYVAKGQRIVLGVNRTGGSAEFGIGDLPAGGHYEVALSDGLNARTLRLQR